MRILVTGANGYIGSKVVSKLLDMGNEVIATDLSNSNIDTRAKYIQVNIFDNLNYYELFGQPDVCLHLAWRDGFVHSSLNHINDLSFHFKFLVSLIDSGIKTVAVMGSMHEVGYIVGEINENTPCNPASLYGIAKKTLREALFSYAKDKNVCVQWLRGYYIYGDDSFGNSIFCKIKKASIEGQKLFPFTTGKNKFDFLHINELSNQICSAILQRSVDGIIEICSGKPISLGEQLETYIKTNKLNIKLDYGKFKERAAESPCTFGNNCKINKILEQKKKRVLITGVNGQLGHDCLNELKQRGYANIKGIDIDDLDITNEIDVHKYINNYKPDIVMHNAAWTAVDKAEQFPNEVYRVNSLGTKYIAESCKEIGAKLVYISTDYVFNGMGDSPFEIDSPKDGLSIYGKTKSEGENFVRKILNEHFIVRISWAFGKNGNNFVKTMLKLANAGKTELNVVCDQIGSVTYTYDLAKLLVDMIETDKYGIYHATNEGYISWAKFADEIFKMSNKNVKVNYVTTEEYKKLVTSQASRPLNSRLSKKSLDDAGFYRLPNWKNALERYLKELEN